MSIKTLSRSVFAISFAIAAAISSLASTSPDRAWRAVTEDEIGRRAERSVSPRTYRTYRLDRSVMNDILAAAPEEFSRQSEFSQTVVTLPMPDGTFGRFRIEHSLMVEPGLVQKYPELGATYNGRGIDDPTATVRLDSLPSGFHAMVLSPKGTVMIDPYAPGDTENYLTYFKRDVPKSTDWACMFDEIEFVDKLLRPGSRTTDLIPDASFNEVI